MSVFLSCSLIGHFVVVLQEERSKGSMDYGISFPALVSPLPLGTG